MFRRMLVAAGLFAMVPASAFAIKVFPQVEDGYPEAKSQLELEQTFIGSFHTSSDHSFKQASAEHELEFGLAEDFTLRVKGSYYWVDAADESGVHFDAAGVEGQYYFTNPIVDKVGISLIGSLEVGEQALGIANFLVIQKDLDKWVFAYNLGLITDIDGVFTDSAGGTETSGTIVNAAGAAYSLSPTVRVGADIDIESSYSSWSHYDGTTIWAGPLINWVPTKNLWITAGFECQLTHTADEPDYQFTVIVGYYF